MEHSDAKSAADAPCERYEPYAAGVAPCHPAAGGGRRHIPCSRLSVGLLSLSVAGERGHRAINSSDAAILGSLRQIGRSAAMRPVRPAQRQRAQKNAVVSRPSLKDPDGDEV